MTYATKNDRNHFTRSYATVDDARVLPYTCESLAKYYLAADPSPVSETELDTFRTWIFREFHNHRLGNVLLLTDDDVTPEQMLANWHSKGTLLISTAHSEHPFLSVSDNVRFRAVHDFHHICGCCGFDFKGEHQTYVMASKSAPESIKWILFSEIVLQASACIWTGEFQAQKLVKYPN